MYILTLAAGSAQQTDGSREILKLVAGYLFCGIAGIAGIIVLWKMANGEINLSRLVSEPNGDASMSRFQFLVFTFVIALSLFFVIFATNGFPVIPGTVLSLLGISSSSYLVSKGIQFSDPNGVQDRAVEVMITPAQATLHVGQTQQFKAEVPRKPDAALKWEVIHGYGKIDPARGLYTADLTQGPAAGAGAPPTPQFPLHATIQVTADEDPELVDLAVVTISA